MKSAAAQELAKKRWKGTTKAERAAHAKKMVTAREAKRGGTLFPPGIKIEYVKRKVKRDRVA